MGTFADFLQEDTTPAVAQSKASRIPEKLLDNLRKTESGKDDLALHKESKAMGAYQFLPETVQMMHKQGIKFNPFDEQEARGAARTYLEKLLEQNKGDLNKAVAQYGGFVKQDPTSYVSKVLKGVELGEEPTQSEFAKFLAEEVPVSTSKKGKLSQADLDAMYKQQLSANQTANAIPFDAGKGNTWDNAQKPSIGQQMIANVLNAKQQAPAFAANALDLVAGLPGQAARSIDYFSRLRSGETPEQAQVGATTDIGKFLKPVGAVTQTLEQPAYENNVINKLMNLAGEYVINPAVQKTAQVTGANPINVAETLNAISLAAPVVGKTANVVNRGVRNALGELTAPEVAATAAQTAPAGSAGAAAINTMPFKGMTGEEYVSGPHPILKNTKVAQDVAPQEQAVNATIMKEILGDKGEVRTGPMTRNEDVMRNEYTEAKKANPTPKGLALKEQIANEQTALSDYAQQRIKNTEAKHFSTESERGEHLNDLVYGNEDHSIHGFIDKLKKDAYKEAKDKVGNKPIESNNIDALLIDPQTLAGAKAAGTKHVYDAAQDFLNLAKTTGFKDPVTKEKYAPGSINGFVAVQKALNRTWSPETASAIHEINAAIDNDIFSAGGGDLFKRGNQIHQLDKTVFEAPGIKRVFGKIDENTQIKKGTPYERMTKELNGMPDDQWRHVYNTFDQFSRDKIRGPIDPNTGVPAWEFDIPKEVQQAANRGKNELKGSLAREVYKEGAGNKGEWSAKRVHDAINARWAKISSSFDPKEQRAFDVLNRGSWLMPGIHAYEGAALQTERLGNVLTNNLPAAGATIGGGIGTVLGAGPVAGSLLALGGEKLGEKTQLKMTTKELEKQAEALRKQMKENSKKAKLLNLGNE
jgi:hypothetical protein